jgi:hypothetical protein
MVSFDYNNGNNVLKARIVFCPYSISTHSQALS